MSNICKYENVECNSADENGNCNLTKPTESGLFIAGERWCDGDGALVGKGKTVEKILPEQDNSSDLWFGIIALAALSPLFEKTDDK